jgi:membrane fusion protein, multidrug efflux system
MVNRFTIFIAVLLCSSSAQAHRALVESAHRSVLSSEIAAKIIQMPFRNGESFKKGDTLIEYDCDLIKTQKEKIEAELVGLRIKSQSYEQMAKLNSIGELEVALAVAETKKKEAELKMADITVSKCSVKAPYDGKIMKSIVREHEYVGEQKELMEIVGTRNLELDILVASKLISSLFIGQKVYFISDETGQKADGVIIGIAPSADPISQTIRIRAKLVNFGRHILPGTIGNAQFGGK